MAATHKEELIALRFFVDDEFVTAYTYTVGNKKARQH